MRSTDALTTNAGSSTPESIPLLWSALAAGAALAACLAFLSGKSSAAPSPGPVAVWCVDRDAQRVYGLDSNLILADRIVVDWPLDAEATGDGGLWVLRAGNAAPGSSQRLDRFGPDKQLITELFVNPCIDLDVLEREQALIIESGAGPQGEPRLARVRAEGSLFPLLTRPDLLSTCGSRQSVAVGTSGGQVLRLDPESGAVLDAVQLGGRIGDLARGPRQGWIWVLDSADERRVILLDLNLDVRWIAAPGVRASHLGPVDGQERVWLADTVQPKVVRLGPGGALELVRDNLPLLGLDRSLAWTQGGALLVAPGAILHVDVNGGLAPGQGGFAFLTDLAAR